MVAIHHKSTADFATAAIRQMIMTGELSPGMRVDQNEIAKQLGVSRHPVRQALERLAERGFVHGRPHHSVTVAELSLKDMEDLYVARRAIEEMAIRLSWPRYDTAFIESSDKRIEAMDRAIRIEDLDEYMVHNYEFHMGFYRPCENVHANRVIASMFQLSERYQRTALMLDKRSSLSLGARSERAQDEHRAMLAAVRSGDLERLLSACVRHNRGTMDTVGSRLNDKAVG